MSDLWSFIRNVLTQGHAQQMDYDAGKYPGGYEEFCAHFEEAASKRVSELEAIIAAPSAPAPAERHGEVAEQLQRRLNALEAAAVVVADGNPSTTAALDALHALAEGLAVLSADAIAALRGGRTTDSDAASVSSKTAAPHLASDVGGFAHPKHYWTCGNCGRTVNYSEEEKCGGCDEPRAAPGAASGEGQP